jgi:hypothetical protein
LRRRSTESTRGQSEAEARTALEQVQAWTVEAGLRLHPAKTRIIDATQPGGFDFLGYHLERGYRWPRAKSLKKFKDTIRSQTRRTQGQSMSAIVTDLNQTLRGWFGYFQNSHRTTFSHLYGWVRMRLRSSCAASTVARDGDQASTISAGPTLSLSSRGCSLWIRLMFWPVNPLRSEPPTGEPDAGEPPVWFGGRGSLIGSPYPYQTA